MEFFWKNPYKARDLGTQGTRIGEDEAYVRPCESLDQEILGKL